MTSSREGLRERARAEVRRLRPTISQAQLERLLGLSAGWLSKLNQKKHAPSAALVTQLHLIALDPKKRLDEIRAFWAQVENKQAKDA